MKDPKNFGKFIVNNNCLLNIILIWKHISSLSLPDIHPAEFHKYLKAILDFYEIP